MGTYALGAALYHGRGMAPGARAKYARAIAGALVTKRVLRRVDGSRYDDHALTPFGEIVAETLTGIG